ncbi:SMP-30/gluconolactonase/LRE family protein [Nocardia amikacinitolerans]|uniref:SMP-30/gluconolactonase/LRE family protein n=1 Tax=Nocardia amikacinitolerans TaxID=756689 RepID=UPI0008328B54|nr:SMP-30/gluconolactonase/LRE family protein [Nocardia amikacinitolerans]
MSSGMGSKRFGAALLAIAAGMVIGTPTASADFVPASCAQGWVAETVVEGVGNLENLDSDGAGGFYVTGILDGFLAHVDASGRFEPLLTGLDHPAGVRVVGRSVYFLTGDGLDAPPGTLQRYDIDTGAVEVLLTGLNGPNGLLVLPDGDLLFTTIGIKAPPTGISRYRPSTGEYTKTWSALPLTNGLALAPDGRTIFTDSLELKIFRIPLDAPNSWSVVTGIPQLLALPDDMEATRDGLLFVADHALGAVYQVDTATGAACAIISGLIKPGPFRNPPDGATSVRIVRDGDGWALYVTSMDGALRRLRPPSGLDLTPADERRR